METYVAIDNVCAWPNLTKLPNGEILAVVFNQPCHLHWEGTIDCWVSKDGGRFWDFRSNPVINDPGTNRGNVAVGLDAHGNVLVLCSGWSPVLPKPERSVQGALNDDTIRGSFEGRLPSWPVRCFSTDQGRTWENCDICVEGASDGLLWIPYGDIVLLQNGRLGCCMYASKRSAFAKDYSGTDGHQGSHFFESSDGGRTWNRISQIHPIGNETALVELPGGKLLAAVRSTHLDLFESTDTGKTWRLVTFLTGRREFPAAFTILKEGELLLTYGIRHNGLYGIGAQLMDLKTEKWWHTPMVLANFGDTHDGGYPSNVQLDTGEILTAYYAKSVPHHNRYHMGTCIWTLGEVGWQVEYPSGIAVKTAR